MSFKQPDVKYSKYETVSPDPEKRCINCEFYKAQDDKKGICYEYEVLPQATCKFFKQKKSKSQT